MIGAQRRRWLGEGARRIRRRAATTPGRLRLLSVLVAAVTVVLGLVASGTLLAAQATIGDIHQRTVPAIAGAQRMHAFLADADRSAANAFLSGGAEASGPRQQYERDVQMAMVELEQAAEHNVAGPEASELIQSVHTQVIEYAQLVEVARTNNRQGFPIGSAYLRQASSLMRRPGDGILARVDTLGELNKRRLASQDAMLRLTVAMLGLYVAVAVGLFALLVHTQRYLRQRFRRRRNPALLAATALLVLLSAWMGGAAMYSSRALDVAEGQAFRHLDDLWRARSLVYDANTNASLSLIARGSGEPFDKAFTDATRRLAEGGLTHETVDDAARGEVRFKGLLADLVREASFPGESEAAIEVLRAYVQFLEVDQAVRIKAQTSYADAVALALGSDRGQLGDASAQLDAALGRSIELNQAEFDRNIEVAGSGLGLNVGIPLVVLAIVLLTIRGLQPRIDEYRA